MEEAEYTAKRVREEGARYRPTVYARKLTETMTEEQIVFETRRHFLQDAKQEKARTNRLLFGEEASTKIG